MTNKEKLVNEALELDKKFSELKGYKSGLTRKMLESFSEDSLKKCNKNMKRIIERHIKGGVVNA